ncbi:MAG: hypothetical protein K8R58_05680 [Bacteroidales bacterium]|nr:hypothetical protein [Bacteroidales bacterium]
MEPGTYQISLKFNQILELVRQLSLKEKIKLRKELEKETVNNKLTELLNIFQTDELSEETINEEVEIVRQNLYAKKKAY